MTNLRLIVLRAKSDQIVASLKYNFFAARLLRGFLTDRISNLVDLDISHMCEQSWFLSPFCWCVGRPNLQVLVTGAVVDSNVSQYYTNQLGTAI